MSYMKFTIAMSDEMGRVEKAAGPARNMKVHWERLRSGKRRVRSMAR